MVTSSYIIEMLRVEAMFLPPLEWLSSTSLVQIPSFLLFFPFGLILLLENGWDDKVP